MKGKVEGIFFHMDIGNPEYHNTYPLNLGWYWRHLLQGVCLSTLAFLILFRIVSVRLPQY